MICAKTLNLLPIVLAAALFTGCTSFDQVRKQTAEDSAAAARARDQMMAATSTQANNIRHRPRIAGAEVVRDKAELPAVFATPISYVTQGESLSNVAQSIAAQIGMPVRVMKMVSGSGSGQGTTTGGGNPADSEIALNWKSKPLSGLLDTIAQTQNLFWRYTPQRGVEFFETESRTFHVYVPRGVKKIDASIALGGSGGGSTGGSGGGGSSGGSGAGASSGGSSVNITSSAEVDPYSAIMAAITSMLESDDGGKSNSSGSASSGGSASGRAASGGGSSGAAGGGASGGAGGGSGSKSGAGGRIMASPDLGFITVSARPPLLDMISAYIDVVNRQYSRNVQIDFTIYSVKMSKQNSFGLSADLIYKNLSNHGVQIVGAPSIAPSSGTPGRLIISAGSGEMSGSKIVATALASLGDVSLVTTNQIIAVNGQPAPLQVADQITYLASSTTTSAPNEVVQ